MKRVLWMDGGDGFTTMSCALEKDKNVQFLCVFHHNKKSLAKQNCSGHSGTGMWEQVPLLCGVRDVYTPGLSAEPSSLSRPASLKSPGLSLLCMSELSVGILTPRTAKGTDMLTKIEFGK